mgnify:CR=1 FL=1|jgi:hypothetical protein
MATPIFNPDDFVFTKLEVPEDNPTLIEYDAKNRLIYLRLRDSKTNEYEYNAIYLTETVNKNLLTYLPDEWTNENDRILLFAVHKNGRVFFEKEKLKYDFETKETKWVRYEYKNLSIEDATKITDALKAAIFIQNTKNENDKNSALVSLAKKDVYLDRFYLAVLKKSDQMLRETDWRILEDAPQSFDGERELWKQWRDFVRVAPKKPEEFEGELDFLIYTEEFKWPVNPETYHNMYPDHEVEYLSTPDQFIFADTSMTEYRETLISEQLKYAIKTFKDRQENGVPITKEMYDIIQQYSLLENIDDIKLSVQGEDQ